MTQIKSQTDISQLGAILGIWAHPDDELFSMGGIMAAAAANGQKVACITATRGEAGVQDESRWPASQLADIRTKELNEAYNVLGSIEHFWLDYPDGGCDRVDRAEAVQRIADIIKRFEPDTILTFGPDGMTGHPDHQTVSLWSSLARDAADSKAEIYHSIQTVSQYQAMLEVDRELNVFFNIDKPSVSLESDCDCCFVLDDGLFKIKLDALRAMPSQTETMLSKFEHSLRSAIGTEAFVKAA